MAKKKKGGRVSGTAETVRPDYSASTEKLSHFPASLALLAENWKELAIRLVLGAWMLAVVLALWPYVNNPATPIKMLLTGLAAVIITALVCVKGPLPRSDLLVGFVMWLGWHGWTALYAMDPIYSLRSVAPEACWVLLGLGAMAAVRRAGQGWNLLCVWILALACAALYAAAQRYGLDPFPWATRNVEEYRALPATFGNPNYAAHALITGVVAAAALTARRSTRWFALLCALPMLWHLWATSMRSAAIALAATAAMWILWTGTSIVSPQRRIPVAIAAACAAAAVGLMVLTLAHDTFSEALTRRVARQDSLALRVNGWKGAGQLIAERPVIGHGPGMYIRHAPSQWQEYEKRWYARSNQRNAHVHNEYLEFGVELGLPGLLLHLWLLLRHLGGSLALAARSRAADTRRFGRFAALTAMAMMVDGLFGFNLHLPVTGGFFFVLLGMTEGVRLGIQQERTSATPQADSPVAEPGRWRQVPRWAWLVLAVAALRVCWTDYQCDAALLRTRAVVEQMQKNQDLPKPIQDQLENTLRQAIARYPWESTFPQRLGWLMLQQGRFAEADSALADAVRQEPWNVRLWGMRAQAMNGWAARAVNQEQNISRGKALAHRAWLYGNKAELLCEPYSAAHDTQWRTALFFLVIAQNDSRSSDNLPSLREFFVDHTRKALAYGSKDPAAVWATLAGQMVSWNDFDRGAPSLAAAMELDPRSTDAWRVAAALSEKGHVGDIIDAILKDRAILRRDLPRNDQLFLAANEACVKYFTSEEKDLQLAEVLFQDVTRALPNRLEAWAQVQYISDRPDAIRRQIATAARRATGIHPLIAGIISGDAEALFSHLEKEIGDRAPIGAANGQGKQLNWLLPLITPMAQSPEHRLALGRALVRAGDYPAADQILGQTLSESANLSGATLGLLLAYRAAALLAAGRTSEALQNASEALRIAPGDGEVLLILARCYRTANRTDEALAVYKKALATLPQGTELFQAASREFGELARRQPAAPGQPSGVRP